ncbi:oligosaccharide flippase family protein [Pseudomonas guariconensis]|uniref:oligosaccharide flippase family protein n=1 Tax=Pseudomonas TaxID=286 RepID=UPI002097760B|nr:MULTISPECIES: oligosaccharide flippase family protein [Pseudomonas]MCO7638975.1 oligosaccharide flippase family protein [Pseudomonas sp. S 311-6]MCO7516726.1 oligosaccharide flippase family protein [Pseudomonas putida]MCO7565662.1 oligosaccharide flippase family protein [Pseudomonas mosselii]MCO7607047.1 oligosaccharide flippase family protein [Pseudomonas guariconensis]MCO7617797.1 oligosaccharide flippase family protein [Pseudomonas guariconensis]
MRFKSNAVNALSLVAIQGANALFPLFVFPYLLVVLGKDAFASLVVAEAVAFYVLTICLYSFDTSGVQAIIESRKHGRPEDEAACFFNMLGARLVLFFVSAIMLISGSALVPGAKTELLAIWLIFVLGMILQSNFYFQAIERNFALAVSITASRFVAVGAIYLQVHDAADLVVACVILAGSFLASGVVAIIIVMRHFGISSLRFISRREITLNLVEGRHLFFGNLSVTLFRGANVLILSALSDAAAVAAYALSEKIIKSIQALARPLNQVFAPKAIKAWSLLDEKEKKPEMARSLIWRSTRLQLLMMLVLLPLTVGAIWAGHEFGFLPGFEGETVLLIALMAPAVMFGVANAMFGAVGLNLLNAQAYFASTVFLVGACIFVLSLVLSHVFNAFGAASAFVLAELFLLLAFLRKYKGKTDRG